MKRFMHAWIALKAIDRLEAIAKQIEQKKPEEIDSYTSINYFVKLLRERLGLVVEGAWIPDNVIHDNNPGHIWKYEPQLTTNITEYDVNRNGEITKSCFTDVAGKRTYYRSDHAEVHSLCFQESKNTYAYDKYWRKTKGQLVDRILAVHQMTRDMTLFQKDEMLNIVASLIEIFGDELTEKPIDVALYLTNPELLKDYYDHQVNGEYVNRVSIIKKRNQIRRGYLKDEVKDCLEYYGVAIQQHIEDLNHKLYSEGEKTLFPMFFSNDEIALCFFSLSHYIADTHMPLHCDERGFGNKGCLDIHGQIENNWEYMILKSSISKKLVQSLSETSRGKEFLKHVYGDRPDYTKYNYPKRSILRNFDEKLGSDIWEKRTNVPLSGNGWEEMVGTTYASYCLSSRLLQFDNQKLVIPYGTSTDYSGLQIPIEIIKGEKWKQYGDDSKLDEAKGPHPNNKYHELNELRRKIYEYTEEQSKQNLLVYNYLSLLLLVDAVEMTANFWQKTIIDHLKVPYEK